jgi:hypothetical protein
MHSAAITEWIVARFTSKTRAASIVGDLLELEPQNGRWWFWLSLAGVLLSLAWRRLVALLAALCAYATALSGTFFMAMLRRPVHPFPSYPWRNAWAVLFIAGSFLWFIFVYAAIRGGVRDRVAQAALALATLITAMVYCWWQPTVLVVCAVLSICLLAASVASRNNAGPRWFFLSL